MGEENNKNQNENQPRRFNQWQYDLLKKCSDKKDLKEWNQYRAENPYEDIELEEVNFEEAYLEGVFLNNTGKVEFEGKLITLHGEVYLTNAVFRYADLKNAKLQRANIKKADFMGADFEGAELCEVNLEEASLCLANLKNTNLSESHLEGAELSDTKLKGAKLNSAHLEGVKFYGTHLQGAKLVGTCLKGADFHSADIRGTDFSCSIVDSETKMFWCKIDKETDFRDVAIDNIQTESGTKQLLKYNIRRMNWENWYKKHKILRWPVWLFWQMSDYGKSTWRIILWFFGLAVVFALIYRVWPGLVMVRGGADHLRGFIHALYFSVVTMTTLGFGDIAANPDSYCGQILLMVQVIWGYVILGALITRLAVLFTGDGPAGEFAKDEKKKDTEPR
jgi:uncharacterized protein YjbI with pentapeptide repeats